jgi:phytoene desaturase
MIPSANRQTVVVIGAGIGGIATAIQLARRGYRVKVVEKNDQPGGRCGRMKVGGYSFDTGATIFLMPDMYHRAFAALGERLEDHLELRKLDPNYYLHFPKSASFQITSDLQRMSAQMEAFEPGSAEAMLRYLAEGAFHHRESVEHVVEKEFRTAPEFFAPTNLLRFMRMRAMVPHDWYVRQFFKDPRLQVAFSFHDLYMGLSPRESPATYSLLQYAEIANGMWYAAGGMYRIVESLLSIAEKYGVEFEMNSPVEGILLSGNRAKGVVLRGGRTVQADMMVANAELGYIYRQLLPESGVGKRIQKMEYGCSTVMFYWGLDHQYPGMGAHNIFFAKDFEGHFDILQHGGRWATEPNFYLHAPSRCDSAVAPTGHDAWVVAVPVPNTQLSAPENEPSLKQEMRTFVLDRLAQHGWTDVAAHIKEERVFGPSDWQSRYNLPYGSTHGLSHRLLQMGYFRPANRHAQIRNLFFAGASTHPGTGIPMVLASARFAAQRILDEMG